MRGPRRFASSASTSEGSRKHRILVARDGAEAVELGLSLGHGVDLLITDVKMPHVSGPEAARRLRRARPDLGVIYASGEPCQEIPVGAALRPDVFLAKPFTAEQLLAAVRSRLLR